MLYPRRSAKPFRRANGRAADLFPVGDNLLCGPGRGFVGTVSGNGRGGRRRLRHIEGNFADALQQIRSLAAKGVGKVKIARTLGIGVSVTQRVLHASA